MVILKLHHKMNEGLTWTKISIIEFVVAVFLNALGLKGDGVFI